MSADNVIQFRPRPRKATMPVTPIDFMLWNYEATLGWLKMLNDFAETAPSELNIEPDNCA
jgi:hypothetical protein